jgi:phage gp29-like protein
VGDRVREAELRDRFGFTDPEVGELVLGPNGVEAYSPRPDPKPEPQQPDQDQRPKPKPRKAQNRKAPKKAAKVKPVTHVAIHRQREIEEDLDAIEARGLDEWEAVVDPLLAPVRQAAIDASTYEEFLARLPVAFAGMDAGRLIEFLAAAMAQARGMGDAAQNA